MASRHGSQPTSSSSFDAFFEGWLARQQAFLDDLLSISTKTDKNEAKMEELIQKVISHYGEYYEHKAKVIREDIFLVLYPPWLTSFEMAFLWVAGFKPSLLFHLLEQSVSGIVSEQVQQLKVLKAKTMREEKNVMEELASTQEKVGSPQLMELVRRVEKLVDGQVSDFDEAMQDLKQAMTKVVETADELRSTTVLKVCKILNPQQTIKFLIAVAKYQLGVRAWGLQKDNQTVNQFKY